MKMPSALRLKAYLWSGVLVFAATVVLVAAALIVNSRNLALGDSEGQATRFVSGAQAALNRSLLTVDVLLASMDEWLALSKSKHESINRKAASQQLRSSSRQNLTVRYVALLDADGNTIASSDTAAEKTEVRLPKGFLADVMRQPVSTLKVSAPLVSFTSAEHVLYFGRYFRLVDGSMVVAIAEVPVMALSSVLVQGVDINGLEVTLERSDGQLLFGVPTRDGTEVRVIAPILADIEAAGKQWRALSRINAEPALVVFRPILYEDLRISASIPLSSALAAWRQERNGIVLVAATFVLMIFAAGAVAMGFLNRMTQVRQATAQSKATLDQALESMESGFLLLDSESRVVQWNRRLEEIYPQLKGVLCPGQHFREIAQAKVRSQFLGESVAHHAQWGDHPFAMQANSEDSHEELLPDGRIIQITERSTPEGGVVITYHDVTELRQASAEIENLAFYDPLTNLPNRRLLMDRIQQAVSASVRSGQYGALLFLDLDHFKNLNDSLGHEIGDMLLCEVAQRLKSCVRREDTVARLGGDEFVVMLQDLSTNCDEAASLARKVGEKILRRLNAPYALGAHSYHSTPSIGATLLGSGVQPSVDLLKQADIAMYQVKSQGRNALCFFDPQMQIAISQRAHLEADLQVALVSQQFELHYQPQFHLDGGVIGAEALIRWRHPERGLIPPGVFIAVAEESELIVPMGHWVLRTACEQLAAWQDIPSRKHVQLSVNVSARQFRQRDFVARVIEVLRETGARPHLLKLELTESLMLENVEDTIAKIEQLKTKGLRFSVDDFGTGYSSLAYLTRLPLDQLKIDQSFVRNLGVKHTDDVIVQTIIGMAQNLELDVIAEGVETQEQKDVLARYGCHMFQGYLLGRPTPVGQLEALLDSNFKE